jgi:sugar lactone lactonase YvrE
MPHAAGLMTAWPRDGNAGLRGVVASGVSRGHQEKEMVMKGMRVGFLCAVLLVLVLQVSNAAAVSVKFLFSISTDAKSVVVDKNGYIYVTCVLGVKKFDKNGNYVLTIKPDMTGEEWSFIPYGMCLDPQGNLLIADWANSKVWRISPTGTVLQKIGSYGDADGQLFAPTDVAADAQGNVYVMDTFHDRVQKYTASGTFLKKWGTPGLNDGQFSYAQGIAVDSLGYVYVTEYNGRRVQKFTSNGGFISKWVNVQNSKIPSFYGPEGIDVKHGYAFIANNGNTEVLIYTDGGKYKGMFELKTGYTGAKDVFVDATDKIYCAQGGGIYVYQLSGLGDVLNPSIFQMLLF